MLTNKLMPFMQEGAMVDGMSNSSERVGAIQEQSMPGLPLLFRLREYIVGSEASTTTCVDRATSPVKEYTPDD
jgi:hypothetical protein